MDEREQRRIEPGMDVNDLDGKKLDTVVDLRPHAAAPPGPGYPEGGQVVEVKTGFLGLGNPSTCPSTSQRRVRGRRRWGLPDRPRRRLGHEHLGAPA
jgi:hypothetical protein